MAATRRHGAGRNQMGQRFRLAKSRQALPAFPLSPRRFLLTLLVLGLGLGLVAAFLLQKERQSPQVFTTAISPSPASLTGSAPAKTAATAPPPWSPQNLPSMAAPTPIVAQRTGFIQGRLGQVPSHLPPDQGTSSDASPGSEPMLDLPIPPGANVVTNAVPIPASLPP